MVRLNKNKLSDQQLSQLFEQLSRVFARLDVNKTTLIFSELLGPEEKVMLAKRLAIIVLLMEHKSLYEISNLLKVSSATAKKLKEELDSGGFTTLVAALQKDQTDYLKLLNTLDKILHLGGILPHYGKRRPLPR